MRGFELQKSFFSSTIVPLDEIVFNKDFLPKYLSLKIVFLIIIYVIQESTQSIQICYLLQGNSPESFSSFHIHT